jgi:hypothetical protein
LRHLGLMLPDRALRQEAKEAVMSKNSSEAAVVCEHGFRAIIAVVLADNRVGLGASPSMDRHRISAGRKPVPEASPERGKRTRWSTFLKAHWKVLAASDFLTVEVWTGEASLL